MRRWVAALGACLILVLSGCASGDITQNWAPMRAAQQFRPAAGTCHATLDEVTAQSPSSSYALVSCAGPHKSETVAVFDLTPAEAADSAGRSARAGSDCAKRVNPWLGGDWRTGWVTLVAMLPTDVAWTGGARWVRCDVAEVSPLERSIVESKGSMKGALKSGGKLLMTCTDALEIGDDIAGLSRVPCAGRHDSEFAGLFEWHDGDPDSAMKKRCYSVIAKFAHVPDDRDLTFRVGWMAFPADTSGWGRGDHAYRCFLWLDDPETGSYRNAGPGKLPVH